MPDKHYGPTLKVFEATLAEAICTSQAHAGKPAPTGAHFYASVLFSAICTRSVSLARILPASSWSDKAFEHWDYMTVAGIVRSLIETRLAFFYLCVEECSADEWDCRWNLLNLHDCASRIELFSIMPDGKSDVAGFRLQLEDLRSRLLSNPFFMQLGGQKRMLNGNVAFLGSLQEIANRAGVDQQSFRILYKMASTQVHMYPLAYYRAAEQGRGTGTQSDVEVGYTWMFLDIAVQLLAAANEEMKALWVRP